MTVNVGFDTSRNKDLLKSKRKKKRAERTKTNKSRRRAY